MITIGSDELRLESIDFESVAPSDEARTEDGTSVHTFNRDSQYYGIKLQGKTKGHAQFAQLQTRLEQLGNTVVFKLDLGSYGEDVIPKFYSISNSLFVEGNRLAGTSVVGYTHDTSAPGGVAPNGLLEVGALIQFKDATYTKTYRVVAVDSASHTYSIYPPLREDISNETEILYSSVMLEVRVKKGSFKYTQKVNAAKSRAYSLALVEDYTS